MLTEAAQAQAQGKHVAQGGSSGRGGRGGTAFRQGARHEARWQARASEDGATRLESRIARGRERSRQPAARARSSAACSCCHRRAQHHSTKVSCTGRAQAQERQDRAEGRGRTSGCGGRWSGAKKAGDDDSRSRICTVRCRQRTREQEGRGGFEPGQGSQELRRVCACQDHGGEGDSSRDGKAA